MCGRFTRNYTWAQIHAMYSLTSVPSNLQPSFNVCPTDTVDVVVRAAGRCEGCKSPAPFIRKNGSPYLEPHHIRRVSDGGPDDPAFVISLCPNCHRRVHAGADGDKYNAELLVAMASIEPP